VVKDCLDGCAAVAVAAGVDAFVDGTVLEIRAEIVVVVIDVVGAKDWTQPSPRFSPKSDSKKLREAVSPQTLMVLLCLISECV
jgi:hypothetical protein